MDFIDQLKTKYKLSSDTEQFLVSQVNGTPFGVEEKVNTSEKTDGDDDKEQSEKIAADFDGSVQDFLVPSAGASGPVPIHVIKPKDRARRPGIIIFFHSGASSFGSCKIAEPVCMLLAQELKCLVVNVEYHEGPNHKFPSFVDCGKTVVRWTVMNKSLLGGEHDSRVGVCGACLGGNIAATVAFETPSVDYQILLYPVVDWSCQGPSFDEFEFQAFPNFNLSSIIRKSIGDQERNENDRTNVRASPLLRKDFSSLPPTLLIIPELDPLKDSNYEFKSKLKAANVDVESKLLKGVLHGFFSFPGSFSEINRRARELILQFYKKHGQSKY